MLTREIHSILLRTFVNAVVKRFITLDPGSTGVGHSTHNPKIGGSNPATGTGREKERESGKKSKKSFKSLVLGYVGCTFRV